MCVFSVSTAVGEFLVLLVFVCTVWGREAMPSGKCHPHTHYPSLLEAERQIGLK